MKIPYSRNNKQAFFSWRWSGSSTQAWMPAYVSILRIPQVIWVWRATVETGKTEELGEKPVPVPLCPPQIPGLRGESRRLTTWPIARPIGLPILIGLYRIVPIVGP
jgi:hypothetical protein